MALSERAYNTATAKSLTAVIRAQAKQQASEPGPRHTYTAAEGAAEQQQEWGPRMAPGGRRSALPPRASRGWTAFTAFGMEARDLVRAEHPSANAADIERVRVDLTEEESCGSPIKVLCITVHFFLIC